MDSIGRSLLLIGVLLFAGPPGHAQGRHGVWMEAGMGYGSASFYCDTCDRSQRLGGYSVTVALGGTLGQHIRLGGDYRNWFNGLKPSAPLAGISTIELVLSYYPHIRGGPFVEGSGGLSFYNLGKGTGNIIDPYSSDTTYYSGTGRGFTLAAGWEFPIRPVGFLWHLAYHRGAVRRLHTPDGATVATGWKQNLLTVELRILIQQT